jgi:hypothetical protein
MDCCEGISFTQDANDPNLYVFTNTTTGQVTPITLTSGNGAVTSLVDNGDDTFTFTNENGNSITINVDETEDTPTFVDNGDGTYTYTDIAGNTVVLDFNDPESTLVDNGNGTITHTDGDGNSTTVAIGGTAGTITVSGGTYSYTNPDGSIVTWTASAPTETVTTLVRTPAAVGSENAGEWTYTNEAGNQTVVCVNAEPAIIVAADDSPYKFKDRADYVAPGSSDQATINAALQQIPATLGGRVHLAPGTFLTDGPILLDTQNWLQGSGLSTTIQNDGATTGAMVTLAADPVAAAWISDVRLFGRKDTFGGSLSGIDFTVNNNPNTIGLFGPDTELRIQDMLVEYFAGPGIELHGPENRAGMLSNVRAFNNGSSELLDAADWMVHSLDVGSNDSHGCIITKGNIRMTNSKFWFSDGNGLEVRHPRCIISGGTEFQDNEQHGVYVTSSVQMSDCFADSNSWNGGGNQNQYDGFHFASGEYHNCVGLHATDKNEGGRGFHQRYGIFIANGVNRSIIHGTTRSSVTARTNQTLDAFGRLESATRNYLILGD